MPKDKKIKKLKAKKAIKAMKKQNSPESLQKPVFCSESDECVARLAMALADPFSVDHVCLGLFPNEPSSKITVFSRGTFVVGTGGIGFVEARPMPASDIPLVYITGATYAGISTDPPTSSASGVSGINGVGSPFVATNFTSTSTGLRWRMISGGIRVRHIGSQLNMNGRLVAKTVVDDGEQIDGNTTYSFSSVSADPRAVTAPVSKKWTTICDRCSNPSANHYTGSVSSHPISQVILVSAQSTGSETPLFEYEAVYHIEVTGGANINIPMRTVTPSISQDVGQGLLSEAAKLMGSLGNPRDLLSGTASIMYQGAEAVRAASYFHQVLKYVSLDHSSRQKLALMG
jgi:hypothetical protein